MRPETQESMPHDIAHELRSLIPQVGPGVFERCGFILVDASRNWKIIEIENRSANPGEFVMAIEDLSRLWNSYGTELIGVWHTHPRGDRRPSEKDVQWAPPDLRYWIVTEWGVSEYDMAQSPVKCIAYHGMPDNGRS